MNMHDDDVRYVKNLIHENKFVAVENIAEETQTYLEELGYKRYYLPDNPNQRVTKVLVEPNTNFGDAWRAFARSEEVQDRSHPDGAFQEKMTSLLNSFSAESPSGTPDFILAQFLTRVLQEFNEAVSRRAEWRNEPVDIASRTTSSESEISDEISDRLNSTRDSLIQLIVESSDSMGPIEDWHIDIGDASFHVDPESKMYGQEVKLKIVQDVVLRRRPGITTKELASPGNLEIEFEDLQQARTFEVQFCQHISREGRVSMAETLGICGLNPTFRDHFWGWNNPEVIRIVQRGSMYVAKISEPIRIDT